MTTFIKTYIYKEGICTSLFRKTYLKKRKKRFLLAFKHITHKFIW